MTAEPLVALAGVDIAFGSTVVLEGVDLSLRPGEIVTIVGPNGAGKSTLLRVVLGLLPPQRGQVRRQPGITLAYVPQRLRLEPTLPVTVARFLALALPGAVPVARLRAALAEVRAEHVMERQLHDLSGGELQRVMLARALLRQPRLLVLDEPVGGVDVAGQAELYELIGRRARRDGCAVLMVSHDLHLVMAATDHVVCLNRHVCCAGHPQAVSRHPAYAALFGGRAAASIAVYTHHHDHSHDPAGGIAPLPPDGGEGCRHG